jgi:hypothetical protein
LGLEWERDSFSEDYQSDVNKGKRNGRILRGRATDSHSAPRFGEGRDKITVM